MESIPEFSQKRSDYPLLIQARVCMGGQVVSLTGDLTALDVTILVGYADAQHQGSKFLLKQAFLYS